MVITHGMNAVEVEELALFLQHRADRLQLVAQEINGLAHSAIWNGDEAQLFRQQLWPRHRSQLLAAADRLEGLAHSARNNASEQHQASSALGSRAPSSYSFGTTNQSLAFGLALRSSTDVTALAGSFFSALGGLMSSGGMKAAGGMKAVGGIFGAYGSFVTGYTIGEDLGNGQYVDAGIETALAAGDFGANALKSKGHIGYAAGVALQGWIEVGRAARNVDWSADGMEAVRRASLLEWGDAIMTAPWQDMLPPLIKMFKPPS